MGWLYFPGLEALSSVSDSPSDIPIAAFVTSSGKPTPRRLSWPGWKTRPWIKRLSGTMSRPSTAARGVDQWVSSLVDSRVKTSAKPDGRKGFRKGTGRDSGSSSPASLAKWDPASSSWKTSQRLLFEDSTSSLERLPTSGSMRSGRLFQRPRWVHRIAGSACSSWPTPRTEDGESCGNHPGSGGDSLTGVLKTWPTPTTAPEAHNLGSNKVSGPAGLGDMAKLWPTPHGFQAGNGPDGNEFSKTIREWPTPNVPNGGRTLSEEEILQKGSTKKGKRQVGLENVASLWPTPKCVTGVGNSKREERGAGGPDLQEAAQTWATPCSRDHKGRDLPSRKGKPSLGHQVFSPQVRVISTNGVELSPTVPETSSRRRLNPAFVCWLMGWPWWWTRAERINSGSVVTESFRSWQQRHSEYLLGVLE